MAGKLEFRRTRKRCHKTQYWLQHHVFFFLSVFSCPYTFELVNMLPEMVLSICHFLPFVSFLLVFRNTRMVRRFIVVHTSICSLFLQQEMQLITRDEKTVISQMIYSEIFFFIVSTVINSKLWTCNFKKMKVGPQLGLQFTYSRVGNIYFLVPYPNFKPQFLGYIG